MNWRRALLWIALFAILAGAVILVTRVAKISFGPRTVAERVLLESHG